MYARHSTHIQTLIQPSQPTLKSDNIVLRLQGGNCSSDRFRNLPKGTQLEIRRARVCTEVCSAQISDHHIPHHAASQGCQRQNCPLVWDSLSWGRGAAGVWAGPQTSESALSWPWALFSIGWNTEWMGWGRIRSPEELRRKWPIWSFYERLRAI